jgi:integrase
MAAIRRGDRASEWWVDFRYRRRRVRKRSPVQTKRGAEQFERQLRNEFTEDESHGKDPFVESPTFAEFAERWMREYVGPNNRKSTQREKLGILKCRLVPMFGRSRLADIKTSHVDLAVATWRAAQLSAKRINNILTVLRKALRTSTEWGLLRDSPRIRHLRIDLPPPVYLSRDEYQRVIAAAEPGFWRTLILFILTTGVRFGEAAALRWEDLHFDGLSPWVFIQRAVEHGYIDAPKTRAGRRPIGLVPETVEALRALPRNGDWLFKTANDNFLRPGNCINHLFAACDRAGVRRVTWHKLRHTVATELMIRGTPLLVVKDILGHKTLEMTARYAHVAPSVASDYMSILSVRGAPRSTPSLDDWSPDGHQTAEPPIPEPPIRALVGSTTQKDDPLGSSSSGAQKRT